MQDHSKNKNQYSVLSDFILTLLFVKDSAPIKSKIMLMKQAFIITKEIAPEILQDVDFFPYKWGPYSDDVAEVLTNLLSEEVLTIESRKEDGIVLTEKGKKLAIQAKTRIPQEMVSDIDNLKRTTEEIGLKRFLEFIYVNYPLYSSRSWGKENLC